MNPHLNRKSLTLIELLIAIVLLSVIVIGLTNIDIFSRYQVISSDRRAKLQNEVSATLDHMSKQIVRAIGNTIINTINNIVSTAPIAGDAAVRIYVDSDAAGGPGDGQRDAINDHWIAYRYRNAGAPLNDRYQIWYYANCVGPNCNQAGTIGPEVIARNIQPAINPFNIAVADNVVSIQIIACWNPASAATCGTVNNPAVTMRTSVQMPSVSTN